MMHNGRVGKVILAKAVQLRNVEAKVVQTDIEVGITTVVNQQQFSKQFAILAQEFNVEGKVTEVRFKQLAKVADKVVIPVALDGKTTESKFQHSLNIPLTSVIEEAEVGITTCLKFVA